MPEDKKISNFNDQALELLNKPATTQVDGLREQFMRLNLAYQNLINAQALMEKLKQDAQGWSAQLDNCSLNIEESIEILSGNIPKILEEIQ